MSTWTIGLKPTTRTIDLKNQVQKTQARVVQHHYVRAQLREINRQKVDMIEATLESIRLNAPNMKNASDPELLDAYSRLTKCLQSAPLTINFRARSWFLKNHEEQDGLEADRYHTMYERSIRTQKLGQHNEKLLRVQSSGSNPALTRVEADNLATFKVPNPSLAEKQGIHRVMHPGTLTPSTVAVKPGDHDMDNPSFNPKSKQVFAALNFGRRPHGATTQYGHSFFVLNDKFKTNALYFAADTFYYKDNQVSAADQVSYDTLGCLYPKSNMLRFALWSAGYMGNALGDTFGSTDALVEAHLFEPVIFKKNVDKHVISNVDRMVISTSGDKFTFDELCTLNKNAEDFAKRNAIELDFID